MQLERRIGFLPATATNVLAMVGVGPFLTIPVMVSALGGPHILYGWLIGALLALCDGLVYAHFAAALPGSGGPFLYLREAYLPFRLGGLMSFLFAFQMMLVAPLSIASGAVGFSNYLGYYWAGMSGLAHDLVAAALCGLVTLLLYRPIDSIGRMSVVMLGIVLLTVGWVIVAGLVQFSPAQAFDWPDAAFRLDGDLLARVGPVALLAMYCYGGYNNICYLGEEVRAPERTLPRAIVTSILVVVAIYVVMSTVVLGTMPWQEVASTRTIASAFVETTFADPSTGRVAAGVMTGLILFVTATGLYALVLGLSRVPFAAARDGLFFRALARVHPRGFPHVSLLTIGATSLPFCFFSFDRLVSWLILVQIALQFIWQCAGVILLRRHRRDLPQPFVMWLYPVPALVALAIWLYVFASASVEGILFALAYLVTGLAAYALFRRGR